MRYTTPLCTLLCLVLLSACGERTVVLPGKREPIRPEEIGTSFIAPPELTLPQQRQIEDWTTRAGFASNSMPHAAFSDTPSLLWATPIGSGNTRRQIITADPVAKDGRIFVRDSGARVTAVSTDGAVLWSRDLTPAFEKEDQAHGGGLGVLGDTLYAATGFGDLHALDVATGAEKWVQRLDAPMAAPTFDGRRLYIVSRDNRAWALDVDTGRIIWELPASPTSAFLSSSPVPAVTDRFVIFPFGSGEIVAALKRSGIRIWGSSISTARPSISYGNISDVTADPVIDNGVVYVGTLSGRLVALNARSGQRVWTVSEGALGPVVASGGSIFVVSDTSELLRIDAQTGVKLWETELPFYRARRPDRRQAITAHFGPVLAGNRLWLASSDGLLRGFEPETGIENVTLELPSGGATRPIIMDGVMYVVSARGVLHAYR